jgi:microcystin-dependent protein
VTYVKQIWQDDVTDADAAHMNHIEDGLVALDAALAAAIPPVVNGKWLKGVGGVAVWSDITAADVIGGGTGGGGTIPGEIKMWPGGALPLISDYGRWVWADGAAYDAASFPKAAQAIHPNWKTHGGKADPGAGRFRVPDLRGQTPIGMDGMPGGSRANRVTRASGATLAAVTGEEYHTLSLAEMASHGHSISDPTHAHSVYDPPHSHLSAYIDNGRNDWFGQGQGGLYSGGGGDNFGVGAPYFRTSGEATGVAIYGAATGITGTNSAGGGGAHENLPTATFVPYIVKLDD